ncbi:hypothetical protein C7212DRAFT_360536 [Tuber magnatum]|uniref:Uncharacterized protein n=1 Tax=Tuber magnatum TaxID=42249 RepID=A0A317SEN0_9PEZI|nr:hypothetical protein C7212DRAFT_360536 [Tuber magnatum]
MSHLFSTLFTLRPPLASSPLITGLTATTVAAVLAFFALRPPAIPLPSVIPSPRELLGYLTDKEKDYLPYPLDFGPTKGKKVVFVHRISTLCPVARDLLWDLVDLYGRGYSDTRLTPHDHLLHVSHMIDELILLAPTGIRKKKKPRLKLLLQMVYSGWIPDPFATLLVHRQLNARQTQNQSRRVASDPMDRAVVLDVPSIAEWHNREHRGFLYSFFSSSKYGPIYDRQEEWAIVGEYLREAGKRILIFLAKNDTGVGPALLPEMLELLRGGEHGGKEAERVVGIMIDGAHDFVRMKGRVLARHIEEFRKDSKSMDWVY